MKKAVTQLIWLSVGGFLAIASMCMISFST